MKTQPVEDFSAPVRKLYEPGLIKLFQKAKRFSVEMPAPSLHPLKKVFQKGLFTKVGKPFVCHIELGKTGALHSFSLAIPVRLPPKSLLRSIHLGFLKIGLKARQFAANHIPIRFNLPSREIAWVREWEIKERKDFTYFKKAYGGTRKVRIYHLRLSEKVDIFTVDRHRSLKAVVFVQVKVMKNLAQKNSKKAPTREDLIRLIRRKFAVDFNFGGPKRDS